MNTSKNTRTSTPSPTPCTTPDLSQHIFDAANAVNDLINYPVEARERVVKADIERSLLDPWRDLPTSGVDPDTGEIKED